MRASLTAFVHRRTPKRRYTLDVAHTYDLLLQARTPGEAAPVAALVTALTAKGAVLTPEGRGTWKLSEGEVTVDPLLEEGVVKGLDVRVPLLDRTALVEDVVKALLEVAQAAEGRVTDPQRGDALSPGGGSALVEEYLKMARYAGEYGAVSGALGLSTWAQPPEEDSGIRWLMMIGVFAAALWLAWTGINAWREAHRPREEEVPADVTPQRGPPRK
jgi:hypothetical protein